MKKISLILILCLFIVISCGMLLGCTNNKLAPIDPTLVLNDGISSLLSNTYVSIEGSNAVDGLITDEFNAVVDLNMNQAKIALNDDIYYYFSKIRFMGNADGISIVDYMTFPFLLDLMGATLLNFEYDSENISSIKIVNEVIIVQFIGKGAKYSFGSTVDFTEGTLSVILSEGNISKTILSTTYYEGSFAHTYTNIASYGVADKLWDSVPKVKPTESTKYANYLLTKLAAANPSTTFHLSTTNYDTKAKVSELIKTESLISSVFVISNSAVHTITITYKESLLIKGIGASINVIDICYNDDYIFYYMYVNSGNKYVLS